VAGADALKPTSELSTEQALNGMRSLPESVRSIEGLAKLQYLKANNKVLLVEPSTRTVVDQITRACERNNPRRSHVLGRWAAVKARSWRVKKLGGRHYREGGPED
jgi:hypothetical protein